MMRVVLKVTLSFLLFALFALSSIASPALAQDIFWSDPAKISQSANYALQPVIADDSKGYIHSVWMETEGESGWMNPPSLPSPGILYSFWNGDTWSVPLQINSPAQGLAELPSMAITPDDNIHVVWDENATGEIKSYPQIYYSRYNGSSWSTPVSISASVHQTGESWEFSPKIAADSSGNVHVLFTYSDTDTSTGPKLYYTKYNGSSWSLPVDVSQGLRNPQQPALAVDSLGNVHVLLYSVDEGIYYTFYNGSVWSEKQALRPGYEAMLPRLTIDSSNNLHAAWIAFDYATWDVRLEYSRKTASWSSPFIVSTTVGDPYWWFPLVGLTVDSSGNAYVGWGQYNSTWYPDIGYYGVDAMYRKYTVAADTWSPPNLVRSTKYLDAPTIWRDKWWNQHFVWSEMNPSTNQWEFWYSELPANVGAYDPSSATTITMLITSDTLKIPAGALSSAATISAQVGPVPASRDPLVTTLPRSYTFRPHTTAFIGGKVATATIRYTDAEILGSNESQMKAYIWDATLNGGLGGWSTSYTTSVNTGANRLSIDLSHFSLYGIVAPKAERKINLTFRPPISNEELYSMVDGSTLPIKFTLTYENGAKVTAPVLPEDIKVYVRKIVNGEISETGVLEYKFGKGDNNVRYDPGNGQYLLNLKTKELNLGPGLYNIKVLYQGFNWGTRDFQIKNSFSITP